MKTKKDYAISRCYETVGEYLREMRDVSHYTQREVADILNYSSAQFISNFERGITLPPLNRLKTLVKLYKLDVNRLMNLILEDERKRMTRMLSNKKHK